MPRFPERLGRWVARRYLLASVLLSSVFAAPLAAAPEGGFRGLLVVQGEEVLLSENPGRRFTPGSVHKLVVSLAALHHLGPEHRIRTEVFREGSLGGGRLEGNLVVQGAGDPTWAERFFPNNPRGPMVQLADRVVAAGVQRVTGDLVMDGHRFPGRPFPASRAYTEIAYGYGAPTSSLAVDENVVRVEMGPGSQVGQAGHLRRLSEDRSLRLENRLQTVGRDRHGEGTVDFFPVWESDLMVARGEYPVSEPVYRMALAHPHPERAAGETLRDIFQQRGIEFEGKVRLRNAAPTAPRVPVAHLDSPPLAEILPVILEDSSNWHAEMLLRILAVEVVGVGRDTDGLDLLRTFLEETVRIDPDGVVLDDGSGLSPYDLLSPQAVVGLLQWAWQQSWRPVFVEALAAPGEGTLEVWGKLPPLAAKSGTVRHSLALAGYLDPNHPRGPKIFAIFLNHRPEERASLRAEIVGLLHRARRGK